MKRTTILAAAVVFLGIIQPASAAEMTLVRNSRPVTGAEALDGAPTGGMVHDFYVTSDADLLSVTTHFNQSVYQHPYGSNNAAPPSELIAYYPAVAADSFFTLPSSTIVLGGGFNGLVTEKAWGDLSNDGPQANFLFGRLTTIDPGSFAGYFAVRGQETYIEMPFSFTLPGTSGPFSETILVSGIEQSQTAYTPPKPIQPAFEETSLPESLPLPPSPIDPFTPWWVNLLETPPASDILPFNGSPQQQLPQPRILAESVAAIPEPAAWTLAVVALPLLVRRIA